MMRRRWRSFREGPRRQDQQNERQELRQPDQAEVEWATGDLVDLPADGDRLHLHGQRTEETREDVAREIGIAQQRLALARHRRPRPLRPGIG